MNREKQTFNNFIVSQANEFAYLVAKKVARESNENFNPLYIYGKIGLGKTFLLKAIENEIKSQCSDLKVVYITTEDFRHYQKLYYDLLYTNSTEKAYKKLLKY